MVIRGLTGTDTIYEETTILEIKPVQRNRVPGTQWYMTLVLCATTAPQRMPLVDLASRILTEEMSSHKFSYIYYTSVPVPVPWLWETGHFETAQDGKVTTSVTNNHQGKHVPVRHHLNIQKVIL